MGGHEVFIKAVTFKFYLCHNYGLVMIKYTPSISSTSAASKTDGAARSSFIFAPDESNPNAVESNVMVHPEFVASFATVVSANVVVYVAPVLATHRLVLA